jgi:hypothetical protein
MRLKLAKPSKGPEAIGMMLSKSDGSGVDDESLTPALIHQSGDTSFQRETSFLGIELKE